MNSNGKIKSKEPFEQTCQEFMEGSHEAVKTLRNFVASIVVRFTNNYEEIKDLTSGSLMKIFETLKEKEDIKNHEAYLSEIVKNNCKSNYRKIKSEISTKAQISDTDIKDDDESTHPEKRLIK